MFVPERSPKVTIPTDQEGQKTLSLDLAFQQALLSQPGIIKIGNGGGKNPLICSKVGSSTISQIGRFLPLSREVASYSVLQDTNPTG